MVVRVPENKRKWMKCKNCCKKIIWKPYRKFCCGCAKLFVI